MYRSKMYRVTSDIFTDIHSSRRMIVIMFSGLQLALTLMLK
jgi:hypothetical protein